MLDNLILSEEIEPIDLGEFMKISAQKARG